MVGHVSTDANSPSWDPDALGMKKQKLLREDILPWMVTNRKIQRLVKVFMDLLSEYQGASEENVDKVDVTPPATEFKVDKMDVTPPATEAKDNPSGPLAVENEGKCMHHSVYFENFPVVV